MPGRASFRATGSAACSHRPASQACAPKDEAEPAPEADPEPEPDRDQERLTILRMVEQGQITPKEAEMLLEALE